MIGILSKDAQTRLLDMDAKCIPLDFAVLKLMAEFPHKCDESGKCEHLNDQNRCMIYSNRPLICNTTKMFKDAYSQVMTKAQFDKAHAQQCKMQQGVVNGK
jgi:hypothetical protein